MERGRAPRCRPLPVDISYHPDPRQEVRLAIEDELDVASRDHVLRRRGLAGGREKLRDHGGKALSGDMGLAAGAPRR